MAPLVLPRVVRVTGCPHCEGLAKGGRGGEIDAIEDLSAILAAVVDRRLAELREAAQPGETVAATIARLYGLATETAADIERDVLGVQLWGMDPFLIANIIGAEMQHADPSDLHRLRQMPISDWRPLVEDRIKEWAASAASAPGATKPAEILANSPESPAVIPEAEMPPPPVNLTTYPIPAPPPGMPEVQRDAWIQARTRAGEYARGLGNEITRAPDRIVLEEWSGETLLTTPDAEKRARVLRQLREGTSQAVARGWTPERLASEMGNQTGEWSRDWNRIARTELSFAQNDASAIEAYRLEGSDARVAVITETGACDACLRLYRTPDGMPRVFNVVDLVANGTNVGRKQAQWEPVCPPAHPRCLCNIQRVPAGMEITKMGALRREGSQ